MPPKFRPAASVRRDLESIFPNLANAYWSIKSPSNDAYQCIAWAACDTTRRWWPTPPEYWPPNVPIEDTVECFVKAFATLGYEPCDSAAFEFGYQKVAIYADDDMTPTHMARQHFFGRGWLSKIGLAEDILHQELRDVEGDPDPTIFSYGRVVQILKRSWWTAVRFGLFQGCWAALNFWLYRRIHPSSWGMKDNLIK